MLVLLGSLGCAGALLMFVADLLLYLPSDQRLRTARVYFSAVDPNGSKLLQSPMADIPEERIMLGA